MRSNSANKVPVMGLVLRLWRDAGRRNRLALLAASVIATLAGLATALPALIVGRIVDRIAKSGPTPWMLGGALVSCMVAQALLRAVSHTLVHAVLPGIEVEYRARQIRSVLRSPINEAADDMAASINSRMARGVDGALRLLRLALNDFLPIATRLVWAVIIAFYFSPWFGLIIAGMLPLSLLVVTMQLRSQAGVRITIEQAKANLDGVATELIQGKPVVRSLDAVERETSRIEGLSSRLARTERRHHTAMARFDLAKAMLEALFAGGVVLAGMKFASNGTATPGDVLTMFLLLTQIQGPLRDLHRIFDESLESATQSRLLFELVDSPVDESFTRGRQTEFSLRPAGVTAKALLKWYPGRDQPALDHVDFEIAPGEFVGICGAAGCGKSTLVKAICGLARTDAGHIILGGVDLSDLANSDLSSVVAYTPQRPYLITGTAKENLLFGNGRSVDDEEIVRVLESLNLAGDLLRLPQGLETKLGEGASTLSGGQQQRLVLARMLLRRPQLLILDEATSALDNVNEEIVMRSIAESGATVIAIAHRLSTLRTCSRIHVMASGTIVETGSYTELANGDGVFAELLEAAQR
jgi:ATP-binding cassette, subfamily B, bacterial